ncbi:MAG: hypothetical protein E7644_07250 [Ruminococcaceae bacterium]|nr:hypothetical protein [Oscillospiraceae bacterium]
MMKKIVCIALAALMMFAMSVSVFAADLAVPGTSTGDVVVNVTTSGAAAEATYKVVVNWGDLNFEYSANTWNPDKMEYEGGWVGGVNTGTINVENRSNAKVDVEATIDNATKNGVTATLSNYEFMLGSAAADGAITGGKGPNQDITVTVTGTPTAQGEFTIGTITVTLSK